MKAQVTNVPIEKVIPDPDQPRKLFAPERMADLIGSIKKHGIISPLQVQDLANGTYLLEDGERRYRAATEIGLKEVPVIIQNKTTDTERLIRQFHLQEQHEGWTATEKATAVAKLAHSMKMSVKDMGKLLSLPERTIKDYTAFADLLERKEFEKTETSLHYAHAITTLRRSVQLLFEKKGLEFGKDLQRDLELGIIYRIKNGDIRRTTDMNKIRDAAKTSPGAIMKFLKSDKMTTQKLFIEADAKVAHNYRNAMYSARAITHHIKEGMSLKMGQFLEGNATDVRALNKAREAIDELLAKA